MSLSPAVSLAKPSLSLIRPWRSPALQAAAVIGISGVGYALANVLLARAMTTLDYARLTLALSLVNVGLQLAPLGADGVVNRRRLAGGMVLLRRTLLTSALVAAAVVWTGTAVYALEGSIALVLLLGILAGGTGYVAAARFQALQRFTPAVSLRQATSFLLLPAAIAVLLLPTEHPWLPLAVVAAGHAAASIGAWRAVEREPHARPGPPERFDWGEAAAYLGVHAAALFLAHLERLLIPKVLSLEALATFGILAALVIAPFRILQLAVGFTLLPRLRAAADVPARRRLLRNEALGVAVVAAGTAAALWIGMPLVVEVLLEGRYALSPSVLLAAMVMGVFRLTSGVTKAMVTALCTNRELVWVNLFLWASVACAALGVVVGARAGLEGVIYGASFGWVIRTVACLAFTARHLATDRTSAAG